MKEEFIVSPETNTEKNILLLKKEMSEITEASVIELRELALTVCDELSGFADGLGVYEMLELIREGVSLSAGEIHPDALECNKSILYSTLSLIKEENKAVFTAVLLEALKSRGFKVDEQAFLPPSRPKELITYVKNLFSDEAFDVFSVGFQDARVKYSQTIKDAVRSLYDSEVGYAILPIEEGGSRIHTIDEIIYKNDFKIISITPVFGQGADTDLKYALISRALVTEDYEEGDDRYIEVRISKCKTMSLTGILLAANLFSLDIYRLGTVSFGEDDKKQDFYSLILKSEGRDFVGMLTYLTLFTDDFSVVGMYKNLE